MAMENKRVFRSRIGVLLIVFILAVFILCAIIAGLYSKTMTDLYIIIGTFVFVVILIGGIRYIILDGKLYTKIGIIPMWKVDITDIISVERSYNTLASSAASLKALRFRLKDNSNFRWRVSPVREQEFIEELKAVNPNIDVRIPEKKGKWRVLDWDI